MLLTPRCTRTVRLLRLVEDVTPRRGGGCLGRQPLEENITAIRLGLIVSRSRYIEVGIIGAASIEALIGEILNLQILLV